MALTIIRDIFMNKCDVIFINDNGDHATFEGEGKVKRALQFLAGKAVVPASVKTEKESDGVKECAIYETNLNGEFLIVTLINYKHLRGTK